VEILKTYRNRWRNVRTRLTLFQVVLLILAVKAAQVLTVYYSGLWDRIVEWWRSAFG